MSTLDQIEARLSAATPGPWAWRNTSEPYLMGVRTRIVMAFRRMGTQGAQPQFRDAHGLLVDAGRENINDFPDAALIANAPADLASLAAALRAIQALHRPYRTHNALSNPEFWYEVCTVCADSEGDARLWPCPTTKAMADLLGGDPA
jgi:hypothetical protein